MEQDRFDKVRRSINGLPGYRCKPSTIRADASALIPQADYIIETVRCDEGWSIFVQCISSEGSMRVVLPDSVCRSLWRHYEQLKLRNVKKHILKARRKRSRKARENLVLEQAEHLIQTETKD
jgi:hypothetical protein